MAKKEWQPNEQQVAFMNALKENGGKATLFELKYFKGQEFKSGCVNALVKKELVTADEQVEYVCDVVYNGVKVGTVKKTATVYELVSND